MQVQVVTEELAQRLGYSDANGMVITRIETNGPADKAGLKVADRILKVNGRTVNSFDDIRRSIYGATVGDKLTLAIEHGGKRSDVTLTLVEAPRNEP
jgi:serine protease Do